MSIKNSEAFLDEIIAELQKMKEDPEKDTLARVLGMVVRVANKHDDRNSLKKSLSAFAMNVDGIDFNEYKTLKNWEEEKLLINSVPKSSMINKSHENKSSYKSDSSSPSVYALTRVIRFCVKVPVLSEQIIEALPKVSTAGKRRIRALRLTIRCTPIERTIVTITGKPSGIAETASETAIINISIGGVPPNIPTAKIIAQAISAIIPRYFPSCESFFCRGV